MPLKNKPLALMLVLLLLTLPLTASAEQAQSPTRVPAIGENVTVYTGGGVLDLSALIFSTMNSTGAENLLAGAQGLSNLSKIWVDTADQNPFSAFCLDFHRSYPPSTPMTNNFITVAWPSGETYDSTMWVIEHSYPALPLEVMLRDAGIDYNALLAEFTSSDEMEAVIYGVIQHAVWYWQPTMIGDNVYYGPSILNGSANLQKLHSYLTQPRAEHSNYRNHVFTSTLTLVYDGELEGVKLDGFYRYGPFHIETGMLSAGDISLTVQSSDGYQTGIVDSDGAALPSVRVRQAFYIDVAAADVDKSEFNVSIHAETTNGMTITGDNRGRVYTHELEEYAAIIQPVYMLN